MKVAIELNFAFPENDCNELYDCDHATMQAMHTINEKLHDRRLAVPRYPSAQQCMNDIHHAPPIGLSLSMFLSSLCMYVNEPLSTRETIFAENVERRPGAGAMTPF